MHGRRRHAIHSSDSTSSSSDDEIFQRRRIKSRSRPVNRCLPMNLIKEDLLGIHKDRMKIGASLADVDPMHIDRTVRFDSIGGLSRHILALKEMVVFPLLYPEVFERFKIQPPRGCLFYGPPGTGKTLVARALANECSQGEKKVSFFMRKGADCLSKWVGESERQLRLLFDQAYQMRPSIIFFDEIDGLAPVRSSRQDQIHSSIVSTLLALMDGLDSRGEVVVIGATNRLDSIDPALRRPGRFDREFLFGLPDRDARKEILKIHTRQWTPQPSDTFLEELADKCVGYCGADIKAVCSEAALCALRRRYPQIYSSTQKLLLDVDSIVITSKDFVFAMSKMVPAAQRAVVSPAKALIPAIRPLLGATLQSILLLVRKVFPHAEQGLKRKREQGAVYSLFYFQLFLFYFQTFLGNAFSQPMSYRPRLLLEGRPGSGQSSHLAPAVLHALEKFTVYTLDMAVLFGASACTPEETCAQVFVEAKRTSPSILYIPCIGQWWETVGPALRATFLSLLSSIPAFSPILLLATCSLGYKQLSVEVQELFRVEYGEVFQVRVPTRQERWNFFEDLILHQAAKAPSSKKKAALRALEVLPVAPPPPPRQLTKEESKKLEEQEEDTLRELRLFLRDVTNRLSQDKRFKQFFKALFRPMDLSTVLSKIDLHQYGTVKEYLEDVDLIWQNALEYNPDRDPSDRQIRHRACALKDTVHAIIQEELDEDFEKICDEIKESRKRRGAFFVFQKKRRRKNRWSNGYITKKKCSISPHASRDNGSDEEEEDADEEDEIDKGEGAEPNSAEENQNVVESGPGACPDSHSGPNAEEQDNEKKTKEREKRKPTDSDALSEKEESENHSQNLTEKVQHLWGQSKREKKEGGDENHNNAIENTNENSCTGTAGDTRIKEIQNQPEARTEKTEEEKSKESARQESKLNTSAEPMDADVMEISTAASMGATGYTRRMTRALKNSVLQQQAINVDEVLQILDEDTPPLVVDREKLKLLEKVVAKTEDYEVYKLEKLYALLCQCIYRNRKAYNKTTLLQVNFVLDAHIYY
uniref:ATPase family AAA domain containing 2 n=1 Tax=Oryzias sinensis TaxID=183150 RepID=A0A8C7Z0T9_9TELE